MEETLCSHRMHYYRIWSNQILISKKIGMNGRHLSLGHVKRPSRNDKYLSVSSCKVLHFKSSTHLCTFWLVIGWLQLTLRIIIVPIGVGVVARRCHTFPVWTVALLSRNYMPARFFLYCTLVNVKCSRINHFLDTL